MFRPVKKYILKKLTDKYFNGVTEEDIFRRDLTNPKRITYRGQTLSAEQKQELKEGAEFFANSAVWKLLKNEATYQANLRIYKQSVDPEDILPGKMMLYALDIIDKVITDKIQKL